MSTSLEFFPLMQLYVMYEIIYQNPAGSYIIVRLFL